MAEESLESKSIYNNSKIILMTISASIGGLSVGYNMGVVCPALLYIDQVFTDVDIVSKAVS